MPTKYDHGVGVGEDDAVFKKRGQALAVAADVIKQQFEGGEVTQVVKSPDNRVVTHVGTDASGTLVKVSIREDTENPSTVIPDLAGSFDISSKAHTPKGRQVKKVTHLGYEEE